tara:strand:+ start:9854 stop:10411 length:558 start_codon:yes stop_codon:yes gene_type:complete
VTKKNTFSSEISQRYALALYELSKESNKTDEFTTNIISFIKVFNSNENLRNFVKDPTYSSEDQKKIFEKVLNIMNLNKIVKNFFTLLIIKKRIFFIDKIIDEFLKIVSFKKGEISAKLISSKKIDEKTLLEIEKEISENMKGSIKLNYKIDESLIGGIVLQVGSLMIDTSIKSKLQKYKKTMIEV